MEPIRVSAVVIRDADGRVLTVRKRGTSMFMFPGGKPDPGERPVDAAVREGPDDPLLYYRSHYGRIVRSPESEKTVYGGSQ